METQNLQAASDYINSLLLGRGLLRNGKPIEFATAAAADGDGDDTMARIINLVHDLVTRRDREAEQKENLASTIRTLRNTEAKQTVEIERLETKTSELARSLALAEGQERALKSTIRDAEAASRTVREQMQRMKASSQQIRSQCANDLRKRDVEMQKLKSHLVERQRGKREGLGVTTITITPPPKNFISRRAVEGGDGLDTPGYSLKQETTEFLTRLCQNLSDENDSLIAIARNCIQTLKTLQGLSDTPNGVADNLDESNHERSDYANNFKSESFDPQPQCETLAGEMESVLEQLRTLLTNPSFVPLEEVELRDNEISRLRQGWEEMEAKWREAVSMMDNWHKRISSGGASINIDELKQGIGLGQSLERKQTILDNYSEARKEKVDASDSRQPDTSIDEDSKGTLSARSKATMNHIHTLDEETSMQASPRRSRRIRDSMENSQAISNGDDKDDEIVLVDKPDLLNVQRRRPKARPDSKISKQPSTRKTAIPEKTAPRKTATRTNVERRTERNKKRSSSSRQIGQRTRRRTNSLGPTELGTAF